MEGSCEYTERVADSRHGWSSSLGSGGGGLGEELKTPTRINLTTLPNISHYRRLELIL